MRVADKAGGGTGRRIDDKSCVVRCCPKDGGCLQVAERPAETGNADGSVSWDVAMPSVLQRPWQFTAIERKQPVSARIVRVIFGELRQHVRA
jgi:hypothetical protein